MVYAALAWVSRRALRWCYRDVTVVGDVPRSGPVLLAVNHPNDLPDICAVLGHVRRHVHFVANVSAAESPVVAWAYTRMGVVPIHRVRDARKALARGENSAQANDLAFAKVRELLSHGACVCVFPEGGVHRGPHLGSLRTGLGRMALDARDVAGVRGIQIVPVGITYEAPLVYRSRVLIEIGTPIAIDQWTPDEGRRAESQLTAVIGAAMRAVTRNAPTVEAEHALSAASMLHAAQSPEESLRAATAQWRSLSSEIYGPGIALEAGDDPRIAPARMLIEQLGARRAGDHPSLLLRAWSEAVRSREGRSRPHLVEAAMAIPGLVLNAPAWMLVRRFARSSARVPDDVIPRSLVPGLYLMFAWYLVLSFVIAGVLRGFGVGALPLLAATLAVIISAPTLGDHGMRWLDRVFDRRRRRWIAREVPDFSQRVERAARALEAPLQAPLHKVTPSANAFPAHDAREVI